MGFSLTFDIGLTVYPFWVCFSLLAGSIGFWYLTGNSIVLQTCPLILILSSKMADFDEKVFFSASDSWILSKIDFLLKSSKADYVFAAMS